MGGEPGAQGTEGGKGNLGPRAQRGKLGADGAAGAKENLGARALQGEAVSCSNWAQGSRRPPSRFAQGGGWHDTALACSASGQAN